MSRHLNPFTTGLEIMKLRVKGALPEERAAPDNRQAEQVIQLWLIDTGCGHDLVSRRELTAVKDMMRKAQQTIILHTANGKVVARDAIDLFVKELGQIVCS